MIDASTERPWKIGPSSTIRDSNDRELAEVCLIQFPKTHDDMEESWLKEVDAANAALIVRAVNSHDALVAALVTISNKHLGDQPAYSEVSEYVWAQQHISELRRIARHALVDFAQSGSTIPSHDSNRGDAQS